MCFSDKIPFGKDGRNNNKQHKVFAQERNTGKLKRYLNDGEKNFVHNMSDKGLTFMISKSLIKVNFNKSNNHIKNEERNCIDTSQKTGGISLGIWKNYHNH